MKTIGTLWQFSRPHTVIGSIISICTLYVMVCNGFSGEHLDLLAMAIIIGVTSNIFIVGINQVADVEIDRINKPALPIPSGKLSIAQARFITWSCLVISLMLSLYILPALFLIIAFSAFIGWAYSMPPLYLKQHHFTSTIAITTVRGVVVNVGGFLVYSHLINGVLTMPLNMRILTGFIIAFSIVISWFKDLPDMEGDERFHIRTFALLHSPRMVLLAGNGILSIAYILTIGMLCIQYRAETSITTTVLLYGHILLFALLLVNSIFVNTRDKTSTRRFYKRFWWFFFAEYLLYFMAYTW